MHESAKLQTGHSEQAQELADQKLVQDTMSDEMSNLLESSNRMTEDLKRVRQERESWKQKYQAMEHRWLSCKEELALLHAKQENEEIEHQKMLKHQQDSLVYTAAALDEKTQSCQQLESRIANLLQSESGLQEILNGSEKRIKALETEIRIQSDEAKEREDLLQSRIHELMNELQIRTHELGHMTLKVCIKAC